MVNTFERKHTVTAAAVMHNFCLNLQEFYEPDEEINNGPEVNIPLENKYNVAMDPWY